MEKQDWEESDFWKPLIVAMIRRVMFAIGFYLTAHGAESTYTDGLTSATLAEFIAAGVLTVFPVLWHYGKFKFDELVKQLAAKSEKETPMGIIQTEVASNHSFISRY